MKKLQRIILVCLLLETAVQVVFFSGCKAAPPVPARVDVSPANWQPGIAIQFEQPPTPATVMLLSGAGATSADGLRFYLGKPTVTAPPQQAALLAAVKEGAKISP